MDFSNERKAAAPDWSYHAIKAREYKGTFAAYCREQKIDYDQFMYHKDKFKIGSASVPRSVKTESGFSQIQVQMPRSAKTVEPLPDAKWLSELIHNLMRVR